MTAPLTRTKLYCLATEANVCECEQLAHGCYVKARGRESNPRRLESQVQRITITPPDHFSISGAGGFYLHRSRGGSVAEWLACWTQAQKGPGSNRSRDAVGKQS